MAYKIENQVVDYSAMVSGYGFRSSLYGIKWIIAHETANGNSTIDGEVSYMKRNASNAFVTHFVGGGGRIIQTAPVGKVCWGAGATANSWSYAQVELCRAKDQATFKKDYAAYIWLLRMLAGECGIPKTLDTEDKGIKTHAWVSEHYPDETDHTDPYGYLNSMGISNAQFAVDIANGLDAHAPVAAPVGVTFAGQSHVQQKGWLDMVNNTLGTVGQGLRLEAFSLVVKNNGKDQPLNGSIHVQDIGNVAYNQNTNLFGTVGQAKRIEAILINVGNGVQYRAHTANIGWGPWVKSGEWAGTKEMGLQIEAIEFRVA